MSSSSASLCPLQIRAVSAMMTRPWDEQIFPLSRCQAFLLDQKEHMTACFHIKSP